MAIVKMSRFFLMGFEAERESLLKNLQRFSQVHLRDLSQDQNMPELTKLSTQTEISALESELVKLEFLIGRVENLAEKPKGLKGLMAKERVMSFDEFDRFRDYDYHTSYNAVKEIDEKQKNLKTERSRLKAENDSLRAYLSLDVSLSQTEALRSSVVLMGTTPTIGYQKLREAVESQFDCYFEHIGPIKEETAFSAIIHKDDLAEATAILKNLGFSRVNIPETVPSKTIEANNNRMAQIDKEDTELSNSLAVYAKEYSELVLCREFMKTTLERAKATENMMKTGQLIVLEGWFPTEMKAKFVTSVENSLGSDYYLEVSEVEKDSEDVPIKLKNNRVVAAFEDITAMFSMPKYGELDPTPVLMPFYWLFFGLMVGDLGYGLILMLATGFAMMKLNFAPGMARMIKFFFILSFSVLLGGVLYGSFFGYPVFTPIPTETGYKAILDSQLDIVTMLITSVAIGAVQILAGVAVKGYMLLRDGKVLDALMDSGIWLVTILGGLAMLVSVAGVLPPIVGQIAPYCLYGGMIGLALTQGRTSPTIGGKLGTGLYAVYGLTGYVGDLVSYTRITALALSGAYIAFSFNLMVTLIPAGIARVVFGAVVFILGQSLNLGLACLGAYVHSCRLQYVEYFGKFYEGGGIPFAPLEYKNVSVKIKAE